jgi:alginate O-acetyltransferase complex protein AlgI
VLFNSHIFLFLFLPLTLLGYHLVSKLNHPLYSVIFLTAASLLFYAWANPIYLILITSSILFNYAAGTILSGLNSKKRRQKLVMVSGVVINIFVLGFFKYANFFIDNTNAILGSHFFISTIILPLAISFFTLQQIGYLVDIYRGEERQPGFWEYCLFVTFFPKLISGPIVRSNEMMPQLIKESRPRISLQDISIGLTILFLGLFKKVILADNIGTYADPVFDAAADGFGISFFNSWSGALAYTFQLYFDFSGYCDMAIGLGLLFGIHLPLNFYSPYKATSIIDFWGRWHMTLSRFVRDYIYIPLGGNRRGFLRQGINLLLAMTIAGLWHGAGWTFVIWGTLHGVYLVINHGWRLLRKKLGLNMEKSSRLTTAVSMLVTFIAITFAWVFFRAASVDASVEMIKGMTGVYGFQLPASFASDLGSISQVLTRIGITFSVLNPLPGFGKTAVLLLLLCFAICWFLPNVQEYMSNYQPALDSSRQAGKAPRFALLRWQPSIVTSSAVSCIAVFGIIELNHIADFIYFRF